MTINEYFQKIDEINIKSKELSDAKKELAESRLDVNVEDVKELYRICKKTTFKKDKKFGVAKDKQRICFVFLFVVCFSVAYKELPHSVRYIISIFLGMKKKSGSAISRDWRQAIDLMKNDQEFKEKTEKIYEEFYVVKKKMRDLLLSEI